ncbi:FGGY family carbohydrate kinase [Brevibacterium moorei]|uniref:FGGY family carbohydrate kinase n=1 Tax=Brevibacterium moorei TaxID=2968457 RepID=UPI00211C81AD|nr:FGGY family carbohydrate kinase [Brevibacterium sp. 68QC2CO]
MSSNPTQRGILAIDEGTTGTRAAIVTESGDIPYISYRQLETHNPAPGVVEQSFELLWDVTLEVLRDAHARARDLGIEPVAVSVATQRATSGLWDAATGQPYGHAMVWQDTRYAEKLAEYAGDWDAQLRRTTGRPAGVRSPYLWAAERLPEPEVARALEHGTLRFGTVDTWLTWKLTGGRTYITTPTNLAACGGYDLSRDAYLHDWIAALGFPVELLPEITDDGATELGRLAPEILGAELPIRAVMGDQHGAILGLGCFDAGQSTCIHGTGSFIDQILASRAALDVTVPQAVTGTVGWRAGATVPAVENFTAATGSALNWLCREMRMFVDPLEITELASRETLWTGTAPRFVPALTGIRLPVIDTRVRASISGMDLSTTRGEVAVGMLEGIAQCVAQSVDANVAVAGVRPDRLCVGGGLSQSDPLVQMQADLTGVPMLRYPDTDKATLRGTSFLAGVGLFWDSLPDAAAAMGRPQVFTPQLTDDQRIERTDSWRAFVDRQRAALDAA